MLPSIFTQELIKASEVALDVSALEICGIEPYKRGPAFGTFVDHDYRKACGFLAGYSTQPSVFNDDVIVASIIDLQNATAALYDFTNEKFEPY